MSESLSRGGTEGPTSALTSALTSAPAAIGNAARSAVRRLGGRWSLRRRVLVVLAGLVAVGLLLADVATYHTLRSYLLNREDTQLDALAHGGGRNLLFADGVGGGTFRAPARLFNGTSQAYYQLRDPQGDVIQAFDAHSVDTTALAPPQLPASLAVPAAGNAANPIDAARYFTVPSTASGQAPFRVRVSPAGLAPAGVGDDTLIVAVPLSDVVATLHKLIWTELAVSLAAVALAVLAGTWLVRLGLRPLETMAGTADEIAAGRLDRRVGTADTETEVGRLGLALNSMLDRIEGAFDEKEASEERLRRFVADASHELRTPLTSIRGYAELFRRGADRRPEDLAKAMARIEGEATRMGLLVEDLLLLARLDQGRPLQADNLELAGVVAEAVDAARAVEPDREIRVALNPGVRVTGDRDRLRQVIDNLLANVRIHTPPGAPAAVRLEASGGTAVLEIEDSGPGLTPDATVRVFERFYRSDPSRSHESGGVGLGLSIVRAIVAAHGGSVEGRNNPSGVGACFVLRLPLAPTPAPGVQPDGAEEPVEAVDLAEMAEHAHDSPRITSGWSQP